MCGDPNNARVSASFDLLRNGCEIKSDRKVDDGLQT